MNRLLGLHLGLRGVTAVSLDGKARVADVLTIPRVSETEDWHYTQQELSTAIEQIGQHFVMSKYVVVAALPIAGLYYRRIRLDDRFSDVEVARYAIEPVVPVAIEKLHIVIADHDNNSSGVIALPLDPWKQLLEMIDQAGWICPRAVGDAISVWELISDQETAAERPELLCLLDSQEGAIVASSAGRLLAVRPLCCSTGVKEKHNLQWLRAELDRTSWFCGDYSEEFAVKLLASEEDQTQALNITEGLPVQVQKLQEILPDVSSCSWGVFYAYCAARSGHKKDSSSINLRTRKLQSSKIREGNRKCLLAHSIAAMGMTLAAALTLWLYGQRCNGQADVYRDTCAGIWRSLFPASSPPAEIEFRLQSELAREKGLRWQNTDLPEYSPALDLLRDIIGSLPADIPIRVREMDISRSIIVISGEARTHGEVEKIANRLTRIKDLMVMPATTERTNEGVIRFSLRLERKESSNATKAA